MSEELKPCPFCGSINIEVHGMPAVFDAPDTAQCADCNACAEARNWNTRAELSRLKAGQGDAVYQVRAKGFESAWSDCEKAQYETFSGYASLEVRALYTSPPSDPGTVPVWRELLERVVKADASRGANALQLADGWKAMDELRAILAQSQSQEVV